MTKSQQTARHRVDTINTKLEQLHPLYERFARCSEEHTRVCNAMSNWEHEREMLITIHQLQG